MMNPSLVRLCLVLALTALPAAAHAQAWAYVVGQRDSDPGPANRGIQILTVIDTSTGAKVGSVPLGTSCFCVNANGAVVSADGSRLYVTNYHDATISVVDTETIAVVGTINTHPAPTALAITPDGSRLYVNTVFNPGPGNQYVVQVIDVASGATITTIPLNVAQSGSGMVISPDGSRVYVSNTALNNSSVKVIDTASNTVISTIGVGITPRGLDVSPDGAFVYAAVQNSQTLAIIQSATATTVASVPIGSLPSAVAVTPDGARAYAANSGSNSLSIVDATTRTVVGTISGVLVPKALDFTPDGGRAFVAADARVVIVNTATNTIAATIPFTVASEGNPATVVIPQALPAPPEPPTNLEVVSVVANSVTLRWRGPATGRAPSNYLVEGGVLPG